MRAEPPCQRHQVHPARPGDGEGGTVDIWVADTGCGIPEDQLERVFQPFHQVENAFNRSNNGTGLGLPLSRKLVERHGGTLHLESVPGSGTVAIMRLPGRVETIEGLWPADL